MTKATPAAPTAGLEPRDTSAATKQLNLAREDVKAAAIERTKSRLFDTVYTSSGIASERRHTGGDGIEVRSLDWALISVHSRQGSNRFKGQYGAAPVQSEHPEMFLRGPIQLSHFVTMREAFMADDTVAFVRKGEGQ